MDRQEDLAAFYARSCPRLIGVLTAIAGSSGDAEEVVQESFVRLLPRWEKVRDYDNPEAWVRAVAVRLLVSRRRRAAVAVRNLRRLHAQSEARDQPEPSPDHVAIVEALRTLPLDQRAVVILHHVLDLPLHEIAAELRVPLGTVKSRLSRGRTALASLLTETEEQVHHE